jgi:hydrogenase maturation protease
MSEKISIDGRPGIGYFEYEQDKKDRMLVMGIGNYLMGDEGIGVHLAQRLEKDGCPPNVDVIDGGTGGFSLMSYFDDYPIIIFIDATMDGKPNGTVSLIKPKFAADFPKTLSVHDVGLKDMVEAVYITGKVPKMYLFTISIDTITPMTMELSPEVAASIPVLIMEIEKLAEKEKTDA